MYFWWFTHLPNKLKTPGEILEGCKNPLEDVSVRAARSNIWSYLLWLFLVNKEMAVTVVSSSFILSVCNHERYLYPLVSSSLSQLKKNDNGPFSLPLLTGGPAFPNSPGSPPGPGGPCSHFRPFSIIDTC